MLPRVGCVVGDILSDGLGEVVSHEFAYSRTVEDFGVGGVAEFRSSGARPFHDSIRVVKVLVLCASHEIYWRWHTLSSGVSSQAQTTP